MIKYSFVVPIYNDAYLAGDFCAEFEAVFKRYLAVEALEQHAEVIFVNDGSQDESFAVLRDQVCARFPFAKLVDLSRNFGQHIAISAGYRYAKGEYVGLVNVDMEDPPDQLPILLESLEREQLDFVGGRYKQRRISITKKITSKVFAWLLNVFTGYRVPLDMATCRVMTRRFIDAYNQLTEKSRYLPGLESWLGFRRGWAIIEHRPRRRGKSSYNFKRRLLLALDSIISFSDLPLKIATLVGSGVALIGFVMTLALAVGKMFFIDFQIGYTSTISIIVFMGGVQILVMGLASLYIGRILREVQNRPLFVVRETYRL